MSKPDIKLIREIYNLGRAKDLYLLITGDSKYSLPAGQGDNYPVRSSKRDFDQDENYICRMAEEHLWFVSEFGYKKEKVELDGKFYSAYPEKFEKWLLIGCKRIHQEEIEAYLKEQPIKC